MKDLTQKISGFVRTPIGTVLLFILIFYVMTFLVYYFYSPGPEERLQAEKTTTTQSINN
jgi:hypothetical protein